MGPGLDPDLAVSPVVLIVQSVAQEAVSSGPATERFAQGGEAFEVEITATDVEEPRGRRARACPCRRRR